MAQKKTPTKKKTPKRKSSNAQKKRVVKESLAEKLSTSAKLNQGDPTSEAELNALFQKIEVTVNKSQSNSSETSTRSAPAVAVKKKRPLWLKAALVLVLLLIGGYAFLRFYLSRSVVPEAGSLTVSGIHSDVSIRRDALGVPFIEAKNLDDMAFGAGFAMASDRGFQMEFLKKMAYGRLSEALGKETIGIDIYMRTLGFGDLAEKNYARLSPKLKNLLVAYAAGVNARHKAYPKKQLEFLLLRIAPEEWQPQDSLALYQLFSFLLATNAVEELAFLKLAAKVGIDKAPWLFPIYDDVELPFKEASALSSLDFKKISLTEPILHSSAREITPWWKVLIPGLPASNNWAVHPSHTKNGKSLLANDTHLQITVPAMWYMMSLECPEYSAAGVVLPGTPVVALGTNGTIAWGATMVMGDNQDIFLEQTREENGKLQYLYKGKWRNAALKKEEIKVRGEESVSFKKWTTRHGPLLNEALLQPMPDKYLTVNLRSDYGLAYKTTVDQSDTTLEGIFNMASVRTMKEARRALDKVTGIYLNIVYADEKNIGWVATGRYPVREGVNGLFPRIGWTGANEWTGYFLPSENPSALNPREGFIATANHRVWDDSSDLWVSASWYGKDRAQRIKELLAAKDKLSIEDMARIQGDVLSPTARETKTLFFEPRFQSALKRSMELLPAAEKRRAEEALVFLQKWDAVLSKDSATAAIYENFIDAVARKVFADELEGTDSYFWTVFQSMNKRSYNAVQDHLLSRADSPFWDNVKTPDKKETKADIFALSLAESIKLCEDQMGKDRAAWAWGKIHAYKWEHQFSKKVGLLKSYLNRGPVAAGGDHHTVNQTGNIAGDTHDIWLMPAMRLLVDFSQPEPTQLIIHMGISGNAESKHYDDMIPFFTEVKNHPLPMQAKNKEKQYGKNFVLQKGK